MRAAFIGTLKGKLPAYAFEARVRTRSGDWKWLSLTGRVTERDADGRARRMCGVVTDIDARKRAEQAMRDAEARYRALIELGPDGVVVFSNGIIEYANPAAARLVKAASARQLMGRKLEEFVQPEHLERFQRAHALPGRRARHDRLPGARAALPGRQRRHRRGVQRVVPGARAPGDAVGAARRQRAAQGARSAGRAREALPRRARGLGRIRLGDRPRLALHLPVRARRDGARLHAPRNDRPRAARIHAAGRGAGDGRMVRAARRARRGLPRPGAPLAHQVGPRHLAVGHRRAGVRRGGQADRLPRHRRRHHRAQAGGGAHPVPRHARRADRPAEPRAARRPRQPGDPRRGALARQPGAAVARPGPLQAGQRFARPRRRRRAAARGRRAPAAPRCGATTRWRASAATSSCCCGTA